jgi:hypothetical protein
MDGVLFLKTNEEQTSATRVADVGDGGWTPALHQTQCGASVPPRPIFSGARSMGSKERWRKEGLVVDG